MSADGSSPVQSHSAGVVRTADAAQGAGKAAHPVKPGISTVSTKPTRVDRKSPTSLQGHVKGSAPAGTVKAGKLADEGAASILLADTKPEADAKQKPPASPFQPGRSREHPQSDEGLGKTGEPSRSPKHAPAAQGTSSKSATSAKSTEVSFDPFTGELQKGKGTLEDYLNQQLRKHGAFIQDTTRSGGNVGQVQDMCKNLANWISHAQGVEFLYTDLVDDPVLLARLVNHEAPKDGQPNPDLDKLVDYIILNDPISRTGDRADTRELIEHKARACVDMLRKVKQKGIEIRVLNNKIEKTKPYVIFGSFTKAGKAGLPIFVPLVDDDILLMNTGSVYKTKGQNRVFFDPAVLDHQPKQPVKD
jgi:hypothetical protein